jgi:hypothetical protein
VKKPQKGKKIFESKLGPKKLMLLDSHKQLLQLREREISKAEADVKLRTIEFQMSVNKIAEELGVSEDKRGEYGLDDSRECLVRVPKKNETPPASGDNPPKT